MVIFIVYYTLPNGAGQMSGGGGNRVCVWCSTSISSCSVCGLELWGGGKKLKTDVASLPSPLSFRPADSSSKTHNNIRCRRSHRHSDILLLSSSPATTHTHIIIVFESSKEGEAGARVTGEMAGAAHYRRRDRENDKHTTRAK